MKRALMFIVTAALIAWPAVLLLSSAVKPLATILNGVSS